MDQNIDNAVELSSSSCLRILSWLFLLLSLHLSPKICGNITYVSRIDLRSFARVKDVPFGENDILHESRLFAVRLCVRLERLERAMSDVVAGNWMASASPSNHKFHRLSISYSKESVPTNSWRNTLPMMMKRYVYMYICVCVCAERSFVLLNVKSNK